MKFTIQKTLSTIIIIALLIYPTQAVRAGVDGKAKKQYEQGNYEGAVQILIVKLRKKPKHQDNINMMETCLDLAVKKRMQLASDCEMMGDWDCAFDHYVIIKKAGDEVSLMPPVIKEYKKDGKKIKENYHFTVPNVMEQIKSARDNALVTHYDKGLEYEEAGRFKEAAIEFRIIKRFNPSYQDAVQRYRDSREKAMVKVAIMPFKNLSGKRKFGAVDDQLTEMIISNAINMSPEFVQFYTRENLSALLIEQGLQQTDIVDQATATELGKKVGVQAFVFGKILNIVEDFPKEQVTSGTDNKVMYRDKQKIPISAQWWKYTRKGSVNISANIKIVDVESGRIMAAEDAKGNAEDEKRWVTFRGNENALDVSTLNHRNCDGETPVASSEVLCQQALENISNTLADKIYSYFE